MAASTDKIREVVEAVREVTGHRGPLDTHANLLQTRVVKSVELLVLVGDIEERFDVSITPRDVTEGALSTIERIADLVAARSGRAPAREVTP